MQEGRVSPSRRGVVGIVVEWLKADWRAMGSGRSKHQAYTPIMGAGTAASVLHYISK